MGRKKPTPSEAQERFRAQVVDWLEGLEKRFGVDLAGIADKSGVNVSTLYRWFDPELNHVPSQGAMLKIATAFGAPLPGADERPGFSERGVTMSPAPAGEPAADLNRSWWVVRDRALELAGYLPGDRVLLDQAEPPRGGDVVIVQLVDMAKGSAETALRIYDKPFIFTRSMDPAFPARDWVDGERVSVVGTIVRLIRERPA